MQFLRISTDTEGESHFDAVAVSLAPMLFAPPAPPLDVSTFSPATRIGILGIAAGWDGDWHPTPKRQFLICLSGEMEVEASDGAIRRVGPGDVVLLEDTTGKGHRSRYVGTGEVHIAAVQIPDDGEPPLQ